MTELTEISGVGPARAETLIDAGYESAEDVAGESPSRLDELFDAEPGEDLKNNALEATGQELEVEDDVHVFEPGFSTVQRYHLLAAVVEEEIKARRTNQPQDREETQDLIEQLMDGEPYRFTFDQIATAYRAANQHENRLRSERGIAGFVSEIRAIQDELKQLRSVAMPAQ